MDGGGGEPLSVLPIRRALLEDSYINTYYHHLRAALAEREPLDAHADLLGSPEVAKLVQHH